MKKHITFFATLMAITSYSIKAQNYTPILVTGYNQDVIAESVPAATVTTMAIDGSNNVLYSAAYTSTTTLGGLNASRTYTSAGRTYQLAAYTQSNVLMVNNAMQDSLILTTPKSYASISLLGFATGGDAMTDITLRFSDGSFATYTGNTLNDWYSIQAPFINGFGRTDRTTDVIDYTGTDPKMYALDLTLSCADASKTLTKVILSNTTPSTSAFVFAISALEGVTINTLAVTCNGLSNGSATAIVNAGTAPYSYTWTSVPTQTTATASGLAAGNYTLTIIDDVNCVIAQKRVTIVQPSLLTSTTSTTAPVCNGRSDGNAKVTPTGGILPYTYLWNTAPTQTTQTASAIPVGNYSCTITDNNGCALTKTVSVYIAPQNINVYATPSTTICANSTATLTVNSTVPSYTWSTGANTSTISAVPTATMTAYTFSATTSLGCMIVGNTTIYTTTLNCIVGVEELNNPVSALYPNPNNGYVVVKMSKVYDGAFIEIVDALGKLVLKQELDSYETTINTSKLEEGIYYYTIGDYKTVFTRNKIMKQ